MNETKKLYRSNSDKVFTGVLAGLGEYFHIDPTILRLGYVLLVIITGLFPGVIAYIIASIIVPEKPHFREAGFVKEEPKTEEKKEEVKE